MTRDQVVWLILTLVASALMVPFIVATFRGWVPRWQTRPSNPRWVGVALTCAYGATLVGSIPFILGASDQAVMRFLNVGSVIGVVGVAVHIGGELRVRSQRRQARG